MRSIIVEVSEDAEVTIQAVGFKGKACEKATEAIEKAIGKVTAKRKTPEWYQNETVKQSVGQ